jgi:Zn-dependent protease/CBS domain-containing protein
MGSSFRIGRIAGVEIGVNWSWLVVFVLITWTLAAGVFPAQNPGLSDATYVVMATVAAVVFFAALLAHELGHALQARREGIEIEGITLWLFGGVARFKGMFPGAGAELRVALAGPLVSAVVAAACLAVSAAVALPSSVDGVLFWLGSINLILLVFNLLPALPLDGGRVLHAALWSARDDLRWATRVAASIGRGFGGAMIAVGLVLFVVEGAFSGAWLAFLGWFLIGAAAAEARSFAAREALAGLRVRDVMVPDPDTVEPGLPLGRFMDEVVWHARRTTYPVVDGDRAVGLIPFRRVAAVPRAQWDEHVVADCMIPLDEVPVLEPDAELFDVLPELASGVGRGLVLDGTRLLGLVSVSDVARLLEVGEVDVAPPGRHGGGSSAS